MCLCFISFNHQQCSHQLWHIAVYRCRKWRNPWYFDGEGQCACSACWAPEKMSWTWHLECPYRSSFDYLHKFSTEITQRQSLLACFRIIDAHSICLTASVEYAVISCWYLLYVGTYFIYWNRTGVRTWSPCWTLPFHISKEHYPQIILEEMKDYKIYDTLLSLWKQEALTILDKYRDLAVQHLTFLNDVLLSASRCGCTPN